MPTGGAGSFGARERDRYRVKREKAAEAKKKPSEREPALSHEEGSKIMRVAEANGAPAHSAAETASLVDFANRLYGKTTPR